MKKLTHVANFLVPDNDDQTHNVILHFCAVTVETPILNYNETNYFHVYANSDGHKGIQNLCEIESVKTQPNVVLCI